MSRSNGSVADKSERNETIRSRRSSRLTFSQARKVIEAEELNLGGSSCLGSAFGCGHLPGGAVITRIGGVGENDWRSELEIRSIPRDRPCVLPKI